MPEQPTAAPSAAPAGILLPSGRFFVRRITLVPDSDAAIQAELALESLSPFPPAQLFHGFALEAGGREALVFASHRRNYTAEETAAWASSAAVLPAFAPFLTGDDLPAAGLGWRQQDDSLEVFAWDGRHHLPLVLLTRTLTGADAGAQRAGLLDEARQRAGLPESSPLRELPATLASAPDRNGAVALTLAGATTSIVTLDRTQLDRMDVRDRTQLAEQRQSARRDRWLWRAFAAGVAGLAACLVVELALAGGHVWVNGLHRLVAARSEPVAQIKSTQELATRVAEMASQQLRPMEMLAAVNAQRPGSITFLRVATTGVRSLEIEAQTSNPGDLRDFETKLHTTAGIDQVELRDPRSRDGQTTFLLEVGFQPGFPVKGGGA